MQRVLSAVVAVALILGLGALAVMALPASQGVAAPAALSAAAPDAPNAVQNFNMIAMPLDAESQFTSASYTYTATGLASLVGTGVRQVSSWDPADQLYLSWTIDPDLGGSGTDFPLVVGGAYWLLLDSTSGNIVSFVGNVPAAGSVQFNLVSGTPCRFNEFSIPLDQGSITSASQLATLLSASQVSQWNAVSQLFESWVVDPDLGGSGVDFTPRIGYPVTACLPTGAPSVWPQANQVRS